MPNNSFRLNLEHWLYPKRTEWSVCTIWLRKISNRGLTGDLNGYLRILQAWDLDIASLHRNKRDLLSNPRLPSLFASGRGCNNILVSLFSQLDSKRIHGLLNSLASSSWRGAISGTSSSCSEIWKENQYLKIEAILKFFVYLSVFRWASGLIADIFISSLSILGLEKESDDLTQKPGVYRGN